MKKLSDKLPGPGQALAEAAFNAPGLSRSMPDGEVGLRLLAFGWCVPAWLVWAGFIGLDCFSVLCSCSLPPALSSCSLLLLSPPVVSSCLCVCVGGLQQARKSDTTKAPTKLHPGTSTANKRPTGIWPFSCLFYVTMTCLLIMMM